MEFPAPAGINRGLVAGNYTAEGVPRASGDKPAAYEKDEFNI